MQITNLRIGMTKNMGNYESAKLEAEAVPSDGQTAESLFTELSQYIESQLPSKVPMTEAPPFTSDAPRKSKPAQSSKKPARKAKGGRPPKHKKALKTVLSTKSVSDFADAFELLMELVDKFSLDEWREACRQARDHYKSLMGESGTTVSEELTERVSKLFTTVLTNIQERLSNETSEQKAS